MATVERCPRRPVLGGLQVGVRVGDRDRCGSLVVRSLRSTVRDRHVDSRPAGLSRTEPPGGHVVPAQRQADAGRLVPERSARTDS